ncbi:hypothetical protein [uncultured Draconibacterium sp.]
MMKKVKLLLLGVTMIVAWSCSTTMNYTWTNEGYQGRKYDKILVVVEAKTPQGRINSESAIVDRLQAEGITASNSIQVFPFNENNHELTEEEIENRIQSGGYDGVLITSLVDASSRDVREGGGTYMQPVSYRYGRYIRTGYVHLQEPEYYRQEKTYVMETRFFDVAEKATKESVVWSGQSELTDPSSVDSAAKSYSKKLVKTLLDSGIIKL